MFSLKETDFVTTPIQEIHDSLFEQHKLRVFIKREDLCHPIISGNKWHKLRLNLQTAKAQGYQQVLSFGGAYSNHIHALAYACQQLGLKSIGIIRGEELRSKSLNPCLSDARAWGMDLHFVSREVYREKTRQQFISGLQQRFGDFYLIPEGGANSLAVLSCAEFADSCLQQTSQAFDFVVLSCGTGCTLTGFVAALQKMHTDKKIVVQGFLAVNDELNVKNNIRQLLQEISCTEQPSIESIIEDTVQSTVRSTVRRTVQWSLNNAYVMGAYGKQKQALNDFMAGFYQAQGFALDPVYTGKMFFGLYDLIAQGAYPEYSNILVLHSGGLQGLRR